MAMKVTIGAAALALLPVLGTACGSEQVELVTLEDSASYAVGANMGVSVRELWSELSPDALMAGIRDAAEGREAALPRGAAMLAMTELLARAQEAREATAAANNAAGVAYREENGSRPGVTTTESGLQYEVLAAGSGPTPSVEDSVRVHYRGTLIDGTEFESTYGEDPVAFVVGEVIVGWIEALQLMRVGAEYRLVVPPQLAYGPVGAPGIGPRATLVFEIELLEIL